MNEFEREVVDRLARIETGMTEHRGTHLEIDRRIVVLEEENIHRSRTSILISAITSAVTAATVSAIGIFWRQS